MFDKFSDRARKIIALAQKEAERFRHDYIGTEHLLLGLVKEGSGVAVTALKNLSVDVEMVRRGVEKLVVTSDRNAPAGPLPFTPQAKRTLEVAAQEARALGHPYVGSEHILLGLLSEQDSVSAQVLISLGLKLEDVRNEILDLLGASDLSKMQINPAEVRSAPPAAAQRLFMQATKEARALSHKQITPEHFQFSLLTEFDGLAVRALVDSGVDPDALRQRILEKMKV